MDDRSRLPSFDLSFAMTVRTGQLSFPMTATKICAELKRKIMFCPWPFSLMPFLEGYTSLDSALSAGRQLAEDHGMQVRRAGL